MMKHLQSRREFFKEASEKALPILGMAILASTPILNSCTKEPDPSGCNGCSNNCEDSSTNSTCSSCSNNCENSSTSSGCSSCSDNCSSGCNTDCTNDCSSNCSNNANNSQNEIISGATGVDNGYEYVDLGLSVKWARCNYYASKPFDVGARVHWGNMSSGVNSANSLWASLDAFGYNYPGYSTAGTLIDRCKVRMGDSWNTPTTSQLNELFQNCVQEWIIIEGTSGLKLTSRINGNSIFLPASGKALYNSSSGFTTYDENSKGYYWSAILASFGNCPNFYAYYKQFSQTNESTNDSITKDVIMAIRPVYIGAGGSNNCNNSCTNTATNGCGSQCSSNCSTGCKTDCTSSCPNGCNTLCGGACQYSCGGTCSYVSAGNSCTSGTCARTCSNYCYRTCTLACSESCMSCCIISSK